MRVAPTLACAVKSGGLTVMTDVENLTAHKLRLQQRELGQLVRVDELPEKQVAELFGALEAKECPDSPQ